MTRAAASSRVVSEPLGGSSLSQAVQRRELPAGLQPEWPASAESWRTHIEQVRSDASQAWYSAIRPAFSASGEAARRLDRVADGRGIVVTTGQQAGLFGGPLYTLNKALTALALADAIEQRFGVPAAPVFWAATDDADFAEAATTHVADARGLHTLTLPNRPPAGTMMSHAKVGEIAPVLSELQAACGSAAHAEFLKMALDAWSGSAGLTVGAAYVRQMRALLEPLGVAVMDSSHPAYREAARPTLERALKHAPGVAQAVAAAVAGIREAGFEPQVQDDRGLSLVFAIDGAGVKRRLTVADASRGKTGVDLSPNVLLRPVVERALLPTVAYVAGPGELAYFAQSNAVATAIGAAPHAPVARWSCTVIEPFADRAMERAGAEYAELRDVHALERRLARSGMPKSVAAAWEHLQAGVRDGMATLQAAVSEAGLMPPQVMEGLERSLAHRLARGERRLLAAAKRRDDRVQNDVRVAAAALFPMGARQERVLGFVPMLARGGDGLLAAMRDAAGEHANQLLGAARPAPAAAR